MDSLISTAPFWLRNVLKPLTELYMPMFRGQPRKLYRNYEEFMKTGASLACLVNLSDPSYETYNDFPAHTIEWDMAGSIEISVDYELLLEAGEIKSSRGGKSSLDMHLLLKPPSLTYFSIRSWQVAAGAPDKVAFLGAPHHHAQHQSHHRHRNDIRPGQEKGIAIQPSWSRPGQTSALGDRGFG